MNSQRGSLFVFSAPSGAGKTTLVKKLISALPNLRFSISYTTRQPRAGETDGIDYFFLSRNRFREMCAAQEFLEYAEVFGNFYGTGREQVEHLRSAGHDVLLEIDWQGARQVRQNQPDCCCIFILPPSISELERRLRSRGTDSDDVIRRRLGEAMEDMSHWPEFDHVVINDDVQMAVSALQGILAGQATGTETNIPALRKKIATLLTRQ
jgi:guanylate kinase